VSRIYFHSPTAEAEVSGTERAWMGCLTAAIGLAIVNGHDIRRLAEWLDVNLFGKRVDQFQLDRELVDAARLAFRHITDRQPLTYQGHPIPVWDLTLNTVMQVGSNPARLATRLHAQCEIHAWVDGPNRAWLADLIDEGLMSGVFRAQIADRTPGWDSVTALLRARDDEPVVTSYSVCDRFPHSDASTWTPPTGDDEDDPQWDAWYDLAEDEQWRHGMEYLRTGTGHLELKPDDFTTIYPFGIGLSWLNLEAHDAEDRVKAALGIGSDGDDPR